MRNLQTPPQHIFNVLAKELQCPRLKYCAPIHRHTWQLAFTKMVWQRPRAMATFRLENFHLLTWRLIGSPAMHGHLHLKPFTFTSSVFTSHPPPLFTQFLCFVQGKKNRNQIMPTDNFFERSGFWAKEPLRKNLVAIFGELSVDLDHALDLKCVLRRVWLVGEKFFNMRIFNAWGH